MGNRGFVQAQHSSFPCHIAGRQIQRSMRSRRVFAIKGSSFLIQLKFVHAWLLTLKGL